MIILDATKAWVGGALMVTFKLKAMDLAARDSFAAQGPVAIEVGGVFLVEGASEPLLSLAPALVSFPDNLPFVLSLDGSDAEAKADLWISTIKARIDTALNDRMPVTTPSTQTFTFSQV